MDIHELDGGYIIEMIVFLCESNRMVNRAAA